MVQPGSIGPLEEILGGLPPDFAATVLAVIHVAENIPNFLDAHQRRDEGRLQVYLQEILAYFIQSRLSCEKVIHGGFGRCMTALFLSGNFVGATPLGEHAILSDRRFTN